MDDAQLGRLPDDAERKELNMSPGKLIRWRGPAALVDLQVKIKDG